MSYVINKFNGDQLVVLQDGTIDTSTSLSLVGRNYVGYGESQNENFVFLLENFANDAPPSRPVVGQLWFNTAENTAFTYDGNQWNPIGSATISSSTPSNSNLGSLWLKTPVNQLHVYTGTEWRFIGPESVEGFNTTRARAASIDDTSGNPRPVIFIETNGIPIAICASENFTIHPNNSVTGFANNIKIGINLSSSAKIIGNVDGTAALADQLSTARLINGIPFNATTDISIKAPTTFKLKKGTFVLGNDFDGSSEQTWSVDATSTNAIGKIVARNSEGGFSAGTITASFLGNLTGNVTATSGTSTFNVVQANQFIGASLSGNAATATRLATSRTINLVPFDGTQNITVTANAATLTGNTLSSTVTLSSLTQVGTLSGLNVADAGIFIGSSGQLRLFVDSSRPTLRSNTGSLNFDMGPTGPDVSFVNASTSLSLGGPSAPAIIGDNTTNLGINGYKFDSVYANNFLGNASTATIATTANNLSGGGLGAIPVQAASSTTSMLGLGADGYVLKSRPGGPTWEALSFEQLNKGSYLNMVNTATSGTVSFYSSSVPVTISVDASTSNSANKIVARDSSGNFAAGTITANLTGAASANVLKSGDTLTGFLTLHANPSTSLHAATKAYVDSVVSNIQYYDEFATGVPSPGPQTFPQRSIRGFSAYNSTDFPGLYHGGITVSGPSGVYSGQIAFNWNSEEAAPLGLYFRVNDDTTNTSAWSSWRQIATTSDIVPQPTLPTYTYGQVTCVGYTNQVGSFNNNSNYFDVFPPAGKSMSNLAAFIPSLNTVHYAGGVNGDDSIRTVYQIFSDRIRVWVQNTEQRSTPRGNYLAIWS